MMLGVVSVVPVVERITFDETSNTGSVGQSI